MQNEKNNIPFDKYSGQWVAFLGGRVVEKGRTLGSLMKKIEKKKLEDKAAIFCVPKKGQIQ